MSERLRVGRLGFNRFCLHLGTYLSPEESDGTPTPRYWHACIEVGVAQSTSSRKVTIIKSAEEDNIYVPLTDEPRDCSEFQHE
jgi:hypothetical protein